MFGSPLTLTLVISLVFGLGAGSALVWLTRPMEDVQQGQVTETLNLEDGVNCWVTIRSAHPMESVRVFRAGEEVEVDGFSETESETEILATETLTFKLLVKWPEGTPETAVLVKVEPEGQLAREQTIWAEEKLTQELTFTLDKEVSDGN